MPYEKPWLSIDEQLALLVKRGLIIDDHATASACLERIGYYRLSGYMYAFRERSGDCCAYPKAANPGRIEHVALDKFKPGSTLKDCVDLYVFDKRLRGLMLDALERIEVALRVDIAHLLGCRNTFAYLSADEFHPSFSKNITDRSGITAHQKWLKKHDDLISRSREDFIIHNKNKTGLPLAIWIACEIWDFGALSKIFSGMKESDQDQISSKYGIKNGRVFATWLETLNYLRNICAHHSRLWNRNIEKIPRLPKEREVPWVDSFAQNQHARARCFMQVMMLSHLLKRLNPNSSWVARVKSHLQSFPQLDHVGLNLLGMGAPTKWKDLLEQ